MAIFRQLRRSLPGGGTDDLRFSRQTGSWRIRGCTLVTLQEDIQTSCPLLWFRCRPMELSFGADRKWAV